VVVAVVVTAAVEVTVVDRHVEVAGFAVGDEVHGGMRRRVDADTGRIHALALPQVEEGAAEFVVLTRLTDGGGGGGGGGGGAQLPPRASSSAACVRFA
jgi:hypothetical protein